MTLEDLEKAGILLPEEEWGQRSLETTVNQPAVIAVGAVAVVAAVLMYVGGGGTLTWVGTVAFLVDLAAFTWVSWRAVEKKRGAPR